jgi:hypothetical protein
MYDVYVYKSKKEGSTTRMMYQDDVYKNVYIR